MTTSTQAYNIFFDKDLNAVVMEWHGYANSEEFRNGTELMLNTLILNNTYKVLGDIRSMTIIGMDDQKWLETNFLPRAIKFGFKKLAIVTPQAYFNKVAVESISYKVDKEQLSITMFNNYEEAVNYLETV